MTDRPTGRPPPRGRPKCRASGRARPYAPAVIPRTWRAVRRSDGETVGYVEPAGGALLARDLLGHELARVDGAEQAEALVRERGLASLARYWTWTDERGETRLVHVVHVRPDRATVSTGMAGVVGGPRELFELDLPVDPASFRPA